MALEQQRDFESAREPTADALGAAVAAALSGPGVQVRTLEEAARFAAGAAREVLQRRGAGAASVVTPLPEILGPVLHMLRFPRLAAVVQQLYIGLLATALDREAVVAAHPAYAEIIRQLHPSEARLLPLLLRDGAIPSYPLLDSCIEIDGQSAVPLCRHITTAGDAIGMHRLIEADDIDNLRRLGLIEVSYQAAFDDATYDGLREDQRVVAVLERGRAAVGNRGEIRLTPGVFRATQFGAGFVHCCLS
jgi:hypothetical protein